MDDSFPNPLSDEEKEDLEPGDIRKNEIKQIQLKREAAMAREKLSTLKKQLMAPEPAADPEVEAKKAQYLSLVESSGKEFKGIEVPDETPFHLELNDSQRADLMRVAKDPNSIWGLPQFRNQDGTLNMSHVLSVIQFAQNPGIMKSVQENYLAAAVERIKNEIQNKTGPENGPNGTPPAPSEAWMEVAGLT